MKKIIVILGAILSMACYSPIETIPAPTQKIVYVYVRDKYESRYDDCYYSQFSCYGTYFPRYPIYPVYPQVVVRPIVVRPNLPVHPVAPRKLP